MKNSRREFQLSIKLIQPWRVVVGPFSVCNKNRKLHDASTPPWKRWFLSHFGRDLEPTHDSYLGKLIHGELQRYRSLTTVQVVDGAQTSFWHDRWLLNDPLRETFPALFSHSISQSISVREALATDLRHHMRPRLTNVAETELCMLLDCLEHFTLGGHHDKHLLTSGADAHPGPPGPWPGVRPNFFFILQ